MILFLDTDVLLDVALDRKPFAEAASGLLEMIEQQGYECFIAWHTVSNLYYLLRSDSSEKQARAFLQDLIKLVHIAPTSSKAVREAFHLNIKDFEDALQVAAALSCGADVLITRNTRDFLKAPIKILTPKEVISGGWN